MPHTTLIKDLISKGRWRAVVATSVVCASLGCGPLTDEGLDDEDDISVAEQSLVANLMILPQLAVGRLHACAIRQNPNDPNKHIPDAPDALNELKCWGENDHGQLGLGSVARTLTATPVLKGAIAVVGGAYHTCALMLDYSVRCFGSNGDGQVGSGSTTIRTYRLPHTVLANGAPLRANVLVAAQSATCAVERTTKVVNGVTQHVNGATWCWGMVGAFTGAGTQQKVFAPKKLSFAPQGARALAMGQWHMCAITAVNDVQCWGAPSMVGHPVAPLNATTPVRVLGTGTTAIRVAINPTGGDTTCAVRMGIVHCWGSGTGRALGDSTASHSQGPVLAFSRRYWSPPKDPGPVTALYGDESSWCAFRTATARDEAAICWGHNKWNAFQSTVVTQPAYMAPATSLLPLTLASPQSLPIDGATSGNAHCAIMAASQKDDGFEVRCWGFEARGCGLATCDFRKPFVVVGF